MKKNSLRYISRIENGSCRSWWVRWTRKDLRGKTRNLLHQNFADLTYGGKVKALKAAKAWRDEQLALDPTLACPDRAARHLSNRCYSKPRRNTNPETGTVGVHHTCREGRSPVFIATWMQTIDGARKPRAKSFSYDPEDRLAKDLAWRAALRHRRKMEKLHYIGKVARIRNGL